MILYLFRYKKIIFFNLFFLFFSYHSLFSNVLGDLTHDNEMVIIINDDTSDETSDQDSLDEIEYGNKWYSRQNFIISHQLEMGVSGTKDYLNEYFLFQYRFKSKNRHAFFIRNFHSGLAAGIFSDHFQEFDFSVLIGFQYLYKIFNEESGVFVWFDVGGCNRGFAFATGVGIGNHKKTGFDLNLVYLHNTGFYSRLEFYFLIFDIWTIRGKMGLDLQHHDFAINLFNVIGGLYTGVYVKNIFKIEVGGGFTVNEYSFFRGFGGLHLTFSF